MVNGEIKAQESNPAVSSSLLKDILKQLSENQSWKDLLVILRSKTVPEGYAPHKWKQGIYIKLRIELQVYNYQLLMVQAKRMKMMLMYNDLS